MSGSEGDVETEGSDDDDDDGRSGRQLRHKKTSPGKRLICEYHVQVLELAL